MIGRLLQHILKLADKITGRTFLYYKPNNHNELGMTAVKAEAGFWYAGNVYDINDIAYGIAQNGLVEKQETELVDRILKVLAQSKRPVVYDIGANTGYYSIFSAFKHNASVAAFEPVPVHVACLHESRKLNRLEEHIRIFTCGLGDCAEEKVLYLGGSGSSFNSQFLGKPDAESTRVSVETLDALVIREQLAYPDFVKIDVEGFEYNVLRGAQTVLQHSKPILFIEISSSLRSIGRAFENDKYIETFSLLSTMGYQPYKLVASVLKQHDTNAPQGEGIHMYLFLHPEIHADLATAIGIPLR